jgi:hypothetical protein
LVQAFEEVGGFGVQKQLESTVVKRCGVGSLWYLGIELI